MNTKRLSRRQFLQLSGGMLAASVLAGCVGPTPAPTSTQTPAATQSSAATASPAATQSSAATKPPAATQPPTSKYMESPLVTAQVTAGKLPPVDQRLPVNPLVITPYESVGKYGGIWRQSIPIGIQANAFISIVSPGRSFVMWNYPGTEIAPNIAESAVISTDAKVYTVKLRKGLKWSDGAPMGTKDVEFAWKAFTTNTTLNPGQTENEGVELNIIDDVTFEMKYPNPNTFQLSTWAYFQWSCPFLPEHYLKQFHPDYQAADVLETQVKDAGFDSWDKFFLDRNDWLNNPDLPTMAPWMLVTQGAAATQLVLDRNPYYWVVDTSGNQLPYIDSCVINIVESADIVNMKVISGEFDIAMASVAENFSNYPLYAENAETGDYKVSTVEFSEPNAMNIHLNIAHKDPVKRAIMETVAFRQAMALAINRPEIISVNYTVGPFASTPRNFSPCPGSPFFDEELSTQFTKFDKDTANTMLDALGLDKRNGDGMRLMPDGNVFSIVIDVPMFDAQWIDIGTMLAKNWQDVGINASARSVDPSLWGQRILANDFDCSIHTGGGGFAVLDTMAVNDYTGYSYFNWPLYFSSGNWIWRNTKGAEGIEPSAAIKKLWETGALLVTEPDKAKQLAMVKDVLQIHKDNLFILGIGTRLPAIYIVKNYVKNVPPISVVGWATGSARPEAYYYVDKPA